ncbi:MAG: hypothetical protein ACK4JE_05815, partial [Endomicrobiia bacterium]
MNKICKFFTGIILSIILGLNIVHTAQVISISTFTASVRFIFADMQSPQITHQPLKRISPYTKIAIIIGTA